MSLSKMKVGPSLNGDIIGDLPQSIIENILSRLPIKQAMRTCILSKKWRYKWVTVPQLVFNSSLGHALTNQYDKLVRFIDGVLSLHRGPICKFELSGLCILQPSDLGKWILYLSRNGIQELILCPSETKPYELSSCLYYCEHLNHLELSFCTLRCPPMFASFKCLRSLFLHRVDCFGFTFENLISRCPLLERLKIEGFTSSTALIIYAPKLKELVINGFCKIKQNICLKHTPLLASVTFILQCYSFKPKRLRHYEMDETSSLMKVFGCLDGVEKLSVGGNFLQFFAVDFIPKRLQNTFYHLKSLDLKVCFNDFHMVSMAFCLIRSAPNLHELKISATTFTNSSTVGNSEEQDGVFDCSLNVLQNVTITSFSGGKAELEFLKSLLTTTPSLDKMTIHSFKLMSMNDFKAIPAKGYPTYMSRMVEGLLQFPRVSEKAKIEYFENGEFVELGN